MHHPAPNLRSAPAHLIAAARAASARVIAAASVASACLIFAAGVGAVASGMAPAPEVGPQGGSVRANARSPDRQPPEVRGAPRSYDAHRAESPPTIDGTLDDAAWQAAPWTEPFIDIRSEDWPAPAWDTRAKITWDADHLYLAARLEEPHLWATLTDRDAILYREHDFELFIDPDGDALAYYELEINALGTEFDLFLDRPYNHRGKADIAWDMVGLRSAVHLDGTLNDPSDEDGGWSVEIAIPWSALVPPAGFTLPATGDSARSAAGHDTRVRVPGAPPQPGDTWRMNFSRVQWPLEVADGEYRRARVPTPDDRHPEHNWVWSPQGEINMHIPERWGFVRFVGGEDR